jgi:hypothetical protein
VEEDEVNNAEDDFFEEDLAFLAVVGVPKKGLL